MRVYHLSCTRCGWKAPLPVDSTVAEKFRRMKCQDCAKASGGKVQHPFTVKERIVVGAVQMFPAKENE